MLQRRSTVTAGHVGANRRVFPFKRIKAGLSKSCGKCVMFVFVRHLATNWLLRYDSWFLISIGERVFGQVDVST